jgi:hypothetical protein
VIQNNPLNTGAQMMTETPTKERSYIQLPDFLSFDETAEFVIYLKGNLDRYGVKSLLYNTEMILGHLRRIERHIAAANKILVRVNGDITPAQRKAYTARAMETIARKFYNSMGIVELRQALLDCKELPSQQVEHSLRYEQREEWVDALAKAHTLRNQR